MSEVAPQAILLTLGRSKGMGEARRLDSWELILESAGIASRRVALLADHATGVRPLRLPAPLTLVGSRTVPESLSWSPRSLRNALRDERPDLVICNTARAFHPSLVDAAPRVVLDFVDRLSVSYQLRAGLADQRSRRLAFSLLARAADRFEQRTWPSKVRRVAAGRDDAIQLHADWLPNTCEVGEPVDPATADHDLLFFGNLTYPPNVAGVERLARLWPALRRARPGTTVLVAGAYPSPVVERLAREHGWTLEPFFADLPSLCARARVAVIPLDHATGIQNKLLEAAAYALPQVVTPAVAAGVGDEFPMRIGTDDAGFVAHVVELLDDPAAARELGLASRDHLATHYAAAGFAAWAQGLLVP